MNDIESINTRLEKLEFHVKLLSESLNHIENPTASLVIQFNWAEQDLDLAHDIFESFDMKISKSEKINWYEFEKDFKDKLGISYQGLKSVVLAFNRNGQWTDVCHSYASSFGNNVPIELKSIALSNVR